jgi:hypothetical protein
LLLSEVVSVEDVALAVVLGSEWVLVQALSWQSVMVLA